MSGEILDPDGARERLAAWKGRIDKLASDTRAMSERLLAVRVTASDRNGLADATVDSTGALVDLKLTDRIHRVTPDVVAQGVLAALAEARNQLADRSQEIVADTVGTESPAARAIAESVGRLRAAPPADPARPPAPPEDDEYDVSAEFGRRQP